MADKPRFRLIVNPIAGVSDKGSMVEQVCNAFAARGFVVETLFTTAPGDAYTFTREVVDNPLYHGVLAMGGDGTVNEVAAALTGSQTPLGIFPLGSGNGLARHLDIPLDLKTAIDIVLSDNILDCDYATVNGHPCFCTFGVGFDAAVGLRFSRLGKRGKSTYLRAVIEEATSYQPYTYRITIDDKTLELKALIVAVCNASQYGNNAYIAPTASMQDGKLDITIVHDANPLDLLRNSVELLTGGITNNRRFTMLESDRVLIETLRPVPAHIDGEPIAENNSFEIICHPGDIRIFSPGEAKVKPIITPLTSYARDLRATVSMKLGQ